MNMLRSARNYDRNTVSEHNAYTGLAPDPETGELVRMPSMTQQHHKEETDINTIVRRFGVTGQLPQAGFKTPLEGDFTEITDFASAVRTVENARDAFAKLPAAQRDRFRNDPGEMIAFIQDEKNREEAIKLGMIPKPPEKTRDAVQAIDELATLLKPKP